MRKLLLYSLFLPAILFSCSDVSDPPSVHTLDTSVTPENGGTVSPGSGEYEEGEQIAIQAEADSGYVFVRWGGDLDGKENPDSIYFDSDKHVTAVFEEKMYSLNIEVDGWGSVHEEVVNTKTDYPEGTEVELTADPRDGWEFSHWEKDIEGNDNPVIITIEEEKTVKAVFVEEDDGDSGDENGGNGNDGDGSDGGNGNGGNGDGNGNGGNGGDGGSGDPPEMYTVSAGTDENGKVTLDPDEEEYEEGEEITAKANSDDGWKFSHWDGDLSGNNNPESFEIKKDMDITAVFEEKEPDEPEEYSIDTSVKNNEGGSVELNPDKGSYEEGEEVTVTAKADEDWKFVEWEGDFTGDDNPLEFEIDEDKEIIAVFEGEKTDDPETKYYILDRKVEGKGTVWWEPYSDTDSIPEGTELTIGANPSDGWEFSHWEGDFQGTTNPIEDVEIDRDKSFTAVFEEEEEEEPDPEFFSITTDTNGEGRITLDPDEEEYEEGTEIEVEAVAEDGWEFMEWEGDFSGDENPVVFTIDQDKDITAVFEEIPPEIFTIETLTTGEGEIILTPDQAEYEEGDEITVEAQPDFGWEFSHWEGNFQGSENPVTFNIDQNNTIEAVFEQEEKVIEDGEVSHGYTEGFTPSDDSEFANRSYPVIQANWEGPGGDKRWTARNLGATDDPQEFNDNDPDRAGWYFNHPNFSGYETQGHYWDGVSDYTDEDWTIPSIYEGQSTDPEFDDPCGALGRSWRIPTSSEWQALADADVAEDMNFHEGGFLRRGRPGGGDRNRSYYWTSDMDRSFGPSGGPVAFQAHSDGSLRRVVFDGDREYGNERVLTVRCIED